MNINYTFCNILNLSIGLLLLDDIGLKDEDNFLHSLNNIVLISNCKM